MQLMIERRGYRILPLLALAAAIGLVVLLARTSSADEPAQSAPAAPADSEEFLVFLNTTQAREFRETVDWVHSKGGRVDQAYPPRAFIATLPAGVKDALKAYPTVGEVKGGWVWLGKWAEGDAEAYWKKLGGQAWDAANIWNHVWLDVGLSHHNGGESDPVGLPRPAEIPLTEENGWKRDGWNYCEVGPTDPVPYCRMNSGFMAGSVSVKIFIVESEPDGTCLKADDSPADNTSLDLADWKTVWPGENVPDVTFVTDGPRKGLVRSAVVEAQKAEMAAGLKFWTDRTGRPRLTFFPEFEFVEVPCEPADPDGNDGLAQGVGPPIYAEYIFRNKGATDWDAPTEDYDYREWARRYDDWLRYQRGTDWAYVIFADLGGGSGSAYNGGPTARVPAHRAWNTTAHESAHIFGATDEYGTCSTTTQSGYHWVQNYSCVNRGIANDCSLMSWDQSLDAKACSYPTDKAVENPPKIQGCNELHDRNTGAPTGKASDWRACNPKDLVDKDGNQGGNSVSQAALEKIGWRNPYTPPGSQNAVVDVLRTARVRWTSPMDPCTVNAEHTQLTCKATAYQEPWSSENPYMGNFTIARVAGAEASIESVPPGWITNSDFKFKPDDGAFDGFSEPYTITYEPSGGLPHGEVLIKTQSENSFGHFSQEAEMRLTINWPPTADAGGPYVTDEGTGVTLDASESSDPDGDPLTYAWDLDGDGQFDDAAGVNPAFDNVEDNGEFTVAVRVTDTYGASGTDESTVTVNNVPPAADAGGPYSAHWGVPISFSGSATDPSPVDTFTYHWEFGDGATSDEQNPSHAYDAPGDYAANLTVTDDDGGVDSALAAVTVTRRPSHLELEDLQVQVFPCCQYSDPHTFGARLTDGVSSDGIEGAPVEVEVGVQHADPVPITDSNGRVAPTIILGQPAGTVPWTADFEGNFFYEPSTAGGTFTIVPENTSLTVTSASVQYSDSVLLSATLTDDDPTPLPGRAVAFSVPGACSGFAYTDPSGVASFPCDAVPLPLGLYPISAVFSGDPGYYTGTSAVSTLAVTREDATVSYDNPAAEQVEQPGGAADFALTVAVNETHPEPSGGVLAGAGDISLATVAITLQPVGPGPQVGPVSCDQRSTSGSGYDAILTATCSFTGVPVNTYSVLVEVTGGYYTGSTEDVLTVYDPSLGFTTGGGTFYWPGTGDALSGYPGDKTNFGFTIKYTRKGTNVQGSLLVVRHLPDGTIYRVKTNALGGLALGTLQVNGETHAWASFSGKATYLEPGWADPIGNHEFIAYVEDRNEPGTGIDRFWLQVRDQSRVLIPSMSMATPATDHAIEIRGGNIVVPHQTGGR